MIFLIGGLIVLAVVAFFLGALGLQLMQQSGRVLEQVEALETIVSEKVLSGVAPPAASVGLPLASVAPPFELPDLKGQLRNFGEWRGHVTLLVFFDAASYHSLVLLESLRALTADVAPAGRPTPLLISIGDAAAAQRLFDSHQIDLPVLVQSDGQVAASYIVDAVPAAYTISEDGMIAGTVVYGTQAVLVAAGEIGETGTGGTAAQRLASESYPSQDGLEIGVQAPIFRLPRLGGGEVSLLEYRGKDTLLVFSDPLCEPCVELLGELTEVAKARPDLGIVVVSRGDEAANQKHAADSKAEFAIGLQRGWEVSREYGLMATPIGYLIDEWGLISGGVAAGREAVLELVK